MWQFAKKWLQWETIFFSLLHRRNVCTMLQISVGDLDQLAFGTFGIIEKAMPVHGAIFQPRIKIRILGSKNCRFTSMDVPL
jgi:hypothetical protein